MKKKALLILYHFLAWIILSGVYVFVSDAIVQHIDSGISGLMLWIKVTEVGLLTIFIGCIISLVRSLRKCNQAH